jgi:hypothetical protein
MVPIGRIAKNTPYSADFLRQLARSGRIRAYKFNRDWLTTSEAVLQYMQDQQKRHRKALTILQTAEKAFLAVVLIVMAFSVVPKARAQGVATTPVRADVTISGTLHNLVSGWQGFASFYTEEFSAVFRMNASSLAEQAAQAHLALETLQPFGSFYWQGLSAVFRVNESALAQQADEIKTALLWQRQEAHAVLASLGWYPLGKTSEEYRADAPAKPLALAKHPTEPRGPEVSPSSSTTTSELTDGSSNQQPRVLGLSTTGTPQPSASEDNSAGSGATQVQIQTLIDQTFERYIASGTFTGPEGPQGSPGPSSSGLVPGFSGPNGMVQNGNGQTTSVIGGTPIVSYYPAVPSQNFTGTSLAGFGNLSAGTFASGNTTIDGTLNVSGPVSASSLTSSGNATIGGAFSAATSTLSALTVSGPATFSGSTTIAGLTVTGFNPGLTPGSIAFQAASGLVQDNANLFWDSTDHFLGLGTTTPSQLLTVAGNGLFTGQLTVTGAAVLGTTTIASLSLGSALPVSSGGTGSNSLGSLTVGTGLSVSAGQNVLIGTSTQITLTSTGTPGSYGSASQVPVITTNQFGEITNVSNTNIAVSTSSVSGVFGYANGGAGSTSYTTNGVVYAGASSLQSTTAGTAYQVLNAGTSGAPTFSSIASLLSQGSNIAISGTSTTSALGNASSSALTVAGPLSVTGTSNMATTTIAYLQLATSLPISSGGTGATTATGATANLQFLQNGAGAVARSLNSKLTDTVSVKDFGATGNGQVVEDAAISNGSNVLTSASANFSSADVGKVFTLEENSPTLNKLLGTIASVTNSTTVVLSVNSSFDYSNAEFIWGTADQAAINSAASSLGSAGGTVYFPPGRYMIASSGILLNHSNIVYLGAGRYSSLLSAAVSNGQIMQYTGSSAVNNLSIANLGFDSDNIAINAIALAGTVNVGAVSIYDNRFYRLGTTGIGMGGIANAAVHDNLFEDPGIPVGTAISFGDASRNLNIYNNTIRYTNSGIIGTQNNGQDQVGERVTVENNNIDLGFWTLATAYTSSGTNVTYSSTTLTDLSGTFASANIVTNTMIRAMTPVASGTASSINSGNLGVTDNSASFASSSPPVIIGDLVVMGNARGIVSNVISNTQLEVEQWLSQTTRLPVSPTFGTYTVYSVIFGQVCSKGGDTITICYNEGWADYNGNQINPANGTLYEISNGKANYAINFDPSFRDVVITNNSVMRSMSDQISYYGTRGTITNNQVFDGQDMGITVNGDHNVVSGNRINHEGSGGIFIGCSECQITDNNIQQTTWINEINTGSLGDLEMGAGASNDIITGNVGDGETGLAPHRYGLTLAASGSAITNNTITDNYFANHSVADIELSGTNSNNNQMYANTGTINAVSGATYYGMLIPGTGNVGIGSTSPVATLAVQGSGSVNPFFVTSSSGISDMVILSNGNVGVGTTIPVSTLAVAGSLFVATTTNTNALTIAGLSGTQCLHEISGVVSGTGSDCGSDGGSSLSGGTAGYDALWTGPSALSAGIILDSVPATGVAGINATSTSYTFNIQGSPGTAPFNVASSSRTSLFTILANGNVGIGTTGPASLLHVMSANGGLPSVLSGTVGIFQDNLGSSNPVRLALITGTSGAGVLDFGTASNQSIGNISYTQGTNVMQFVTNSVARMAINTSGNVGIGTTSPASLLYVQKMSTSSTVGLLDVASSTGSSILFVANNGNVGIGTSTPSQLLTVYGNLTVATGSTQTLLVNSATQTVQVQNLTVAGLSGTQCLQETNGVVSGTGSSCGGGGGGGSITINGLTDTNFVLAAGSGISIATSSSPSTVTISNSGAGANFWTQNGSAIYDNLGSQAGINSSTPVANLVVEGSAINSTIPVFTVASSSNNTYFTVLANGNVGIGTTTPTQPLSVVGNVTMTGNNFYSTGTGGKLVFVDSGNGSETSLQFAGANIGLASQALSYGYIESTSTYPIKVFMGSTVSEEIQGTGDVNIGGYTTDCGLFCIATSSSQLFVVATSTGNVGIGTASPQYLLQAGNSSVSGIVARFQNINGTCDVNPTTGTLACSSDARLKKNITPMGDDLSQVMALQPVYFNWNAETSGTPEHPGFIAQQVQQVMPGVVSNDPTTGLLSIGYSDLVPAMVSAMQQMQAEITTLQGGLNGNASSSDLTVYVPSNFSGDSVGEAEIPAGQTSVRVSFDQAYEYQPIVTVTAVDVPTYGYVSDVDSTGFTINLPTPVVSEVVFDWHSFASPDEQLTVSGGTTQPIVLVVASSTPTSGPQVTVTSDSTDSSSTSQTDLVSPATSTPAVLGTSTPASTQAGEDSITTTSSLASSSVPSVVTPTLPPAPAPAPTADSTPSPAISITTTPSLAVTTPPADASTSVDADPGSGLSTAN